MWSKKTQERQVQNLPPRFRFQIRFVIYCTVKLVEKKSGARSADAPRKTRPVGAVDLRVRAYLLPLPPDASWLDGEEGEFGA